MFRKRVAVEVSNVLAVKGVADLQVEAYLEVPPRAELGDYAFPCFRLAKQMRQAPMQIAWDLANELRVVPWLQRVDAVNGYLNIFIEPASYSEGVVSHILQAGPNYGAGHGEGVIVIDFSSPNIAKPFSVGHIRSTVIGHSLAEIYSHLGYRVERINHLGDWGTQFGKLMVAYQRWGDQAALRQQPLAELLRIYVRYHEEAALDASLDDQARLWFRRLEDGDQEAVRLWTTFRDVSLVEFQRVYERLGIGFDTFCGESFYNDKMEDTVRTLDDMGLLTESDGALVVDMGGDAAPCLITKRDGATLYATRDITAAVYRWQTYRFTKLLYVVGVTQSLHFQQVFEVLRRMGHAWSERCSHVPFGTIFFGDASMSTRKGNVVFLEDILDEAVNRVGRILDGRGLDAQQRRDIAEQVGVGAVVFNELVHSRIKDTTFDWERIISLEGDTGPYVQYTATRANSVFRKAARDLGDLGGFDARCLVDAESLAVVRLLEKFPGIVAKAAESNEPSLIARYCLDVAAAYNGFYHKHRILGSGAKEETARLALTKATSHVLTLGLRLLGIRVPAVM